MSWDSIIAFLIIAGLILAAWARVSNQTVAELLREILDILRDAKENAAERGEEIIYYE